MATQLKVLAARRISRKEHDALNRSIHRREIAALLVLGHEKRLVRDASKNRDRAVRRERAECHGLPEERASVLAGQTRFAVRHERKILAKGFLARAALAGRLVRAQEPVPHACVHREQEEKQHDAVLVRDGGLAHQRAHAREPVDAVRERGKLPLNIIDHLQHELPNKVGVSGKDDVEQKIVHLQ